MHGLLASIIAGGGGYSASGDHMYFVLDSNHASYGAHSAALLTYPNSSIVGSATHDTTLKVIRATVTDAELDSTGALADLRTANYPTALCRHRWTSVADASQTSNGRVTPLAESKALDRARLGLR